VKRFHAKSNTQRRQASSIFDTAPALQKDYSPTSSAFSRELELTLESKLAEFEESKPRIVETEKDLTLQEVRYDKLDLI
jgi:hypothetical protein